MGSATRMPQHLPWGVGFSAICLAVSVVSVVFAHAPPGMM